MTKKYTAPTVYFGPEDRVDPTKSQPDAVGEPIEGEWHHVLIRRRLGVGEEAGVMNEATEAARLREELDAARREVARLRDVALKVEVIANRLLTLSDEMADEGMAGWPNELRDIADAMRTWPKD